MRIEYTEKKRDQFWGINIKCEGKPCVGIGYVKRENETTFSCKVIGMRYTMLESFEAAEKAVNEHVFELLVMEAGK